MKKIIALMLAVILVFAFSACGEKSTSTKTDSSIPANTEEFIKPENYTSVLQITINPIFKLYLDENNIVLAVEPVNEDAKSFSDSIEFENTSVEKVIENIVEQSSKNGFIKDNATVNFEMAEQKDGIDNSDILTKVISAANKKATELNVEIKTETKENDNTETSENLNNTESSKPETTTDNHETKPKPTESKPTHTHSFSAATCTTPAKCSCGETKGSALGHKWQNATCTSPKTCSVCKATEGDKLNHTYDKEGICSLCNAKDPNFVYPKVSSMNGTWKSYYVEGNLLIGHIHSFVPNGLPYTYYVEEMVYGTKEEIISNNWTLENKESIVCEGITYYFMGGGEALCGVFEESNDKIVTTNCNSDEKKMVLQRTSTTSLVVISFAPALEVNAKIPVGTVIKLY